MVDETTTDEGTPAPESGPEQAEPTTAPEGAKGAEPEAASSNQAPENASEAQAPESSGDDGARGDEGGSTAQTALLAVLVAIFAAAALKATAGILIPLVLAIFLCYLLGPVMSFLARHRVPEGLTIPASMLLLVVALIPLNAVVVSTIGEIENRIPYYAMRFQDIADATLGALGADADFLTEANWVEEISGALSSLTVSMFGSVISFVGKLVLVITYTVFILLGRKGFEANIRRAFSARRASNLEDIFEQMNLQIQKYIATKILVSFATGFSMFLALMFFGVDFALFWGMLGFLLNFIPTVGSAIAAILPIGVAFLQFENPISAVWVAVVLIAIQQLIGNVIEPAIQGKRLNMSPIVVLFALVFFGWLWGFWGMVMSVPLMAVIKIVFEHTPALKPFAVMLEKG